MKLRLALVSLIALALPLAGCVENMAQLKDKISPNSKAVQAATVPTVATAGKVNVSGPSLKAPIARMQIYGDGGALVYKASFIAENVSSPVSASPGNFTFVSTDSESSNNCGADGLRAWTWVIDGMTMPGRKATMAIATPGVKVVSLTVTDCFGLADVQQVHIGIQPQPFDVKSKWAGSPKGNAQCGSPLDDQSTISQKVPLASTLDGKTVTVQAVEIKTSSTMTGPADNSAVDVYFMYLLGPDGKVVGKDESGVATPTVKTGTLAAGAYTLKIVQCTGPPSDVAGTIVITYLEVISGLSHDSMAGMKM